MIITKSLRPAGVSFFCTCIMMVVILLLPAGRASAEENFQITPALNDAWYNPETAGQGFLITVLPKSDVVFLAWFTYDTDEADAVGEAHLGEANHRWLTAEGLISGARSEMTVYISAGGVFDTPTTVENRVDGSLILSFESCSRGQVEYDIPSIGRKGTIPIQRVAEDNVVDCELESLATSTGLRTQSAEPPPRTQASGSLINTGMNDAWYNPATAGQGFLITVLPKTDVVFLAWFTYDTDEADKIGTSHFGEPNHRWITAEGRIDGDMSEMTVYITSGGLFDTGTPVGNRVDGTLKLSFDGCNSGSVEYNILSISRQSTVPIQRVATDNVALCESQLEVDVWEYWAHEDVKILDSWGEQADEHLDLVALYEKEESSSIALRVDYMDLKSSSLTPTYLGLDFSAGGIRNITQDDGSLNLDIDWDVLIVAQGENISAIDSSFNQLEGVLTNPVVDHQLDFFSVNIDKSALQGWGGGEFSMQALTASSDMAIQMDETPVASTSSVSGKAKFVLPHMNAFTNSSPADIGAYDGYWLPQFLQENKRGGLRYFLDAAEKYDVPVVITDLRLDRLSGNEFLGLMDRFRSMDKAGTLSMLSNMNYGHFMAWWPDVVDRNAIDLALKLKTNMGAPISEVFYPYEAILTPSDIEVIKDTGFKAVWGLDQYRYWFGSIPDNADGDTWRAEVKSLRKIHRINGMDFFFDTRIGNYGGLIPDDRWGNPDWGAYSEPWLSEGSDGGLHSWLRRTLLDMATETDQEQFYTFGTDLGYSKWQYGEVADANFKWLASHPWIEVTTFDDIASRNWGVIDHGTLDLAGDELLIRFEREGDQHYNAYLPSFYYGGVSNGHSPLIPAGVQIESFYDHVPILRDGLPIPSGRIMGDYKTPGSIIYETIKNLEAAPDNPVAELAWLAFHHVVGEITYHEGEKLSNSAKFQANYVGHVNKIVAAADWAEQAAAGLVGSTTVVTAEDLDLDGEDEYTMHNDRVFAVFENDGGRLEYAFAFDPANGPVQLVAPFNQHNFYGGSVEQYELGEAAISALRQGLDSAFSENQSVGNDGFEYAVMAASMTSGALKFETGDGRISKEFTLAGDRLTANYSLKNLASVTPGFAFVTNLLNTYERDWDEDLQFINFNNEEIGWRSSEGGYAVVNTDDTWLLGFASFLESPAPTEMRQRDDANSYPTGHYIAYPYGVVRVSSENAGSNFNVSVILSAKD